MIRSFIIIAEHEHDRMENQATLNACLPALQVIDAIYPTRTHVPFLKQLQELSYERTGWRMNPGEIGVLLSNRKAWREIVKQAVSDDEMFLILESDSSILDNEALHMFFQEQQKEYDLFFWGGWSGHMKLERSTKRKTSDKYTIGTPFIKTVYGAYGYSLNRKAAQYLLRSTGKISHPVDQYKHYIEKGALRVGAVVPEIITHLETESTIGHPYMSAWRKKILFLGLDCKNAIISFFK